MLSDLAFQEGIKRIESRFDKKLKVSALKEYYDYLKLKLTDEQFIAASRALFAESTRYPRPVDFVEAAPPNDPVYRGEQDGNPYEPVKLYVKEGSSAHKQYLRVWAQRDRDGVQVPSHSRDGFPAPVVVVLAPDEWEAQMSRQKMGVT
jgi:hypothetical protein